MAHNGRYFFSPCFTTKASHPVTHLALLVGQARSSYIYAFMFLMDFTVKIKFFQDAKFEFLPLNLHKTEERCKKGQGQQLNVCYPWTHDGL